MTRLWSVCPDAVSAKACGASYHLLYKKPEVEGKCGKCGGTLVQRKDDHPDTVKERLHVYHEQTEPLKDYYEKQGKLRIVEGQEEVADTTKLTSGCIRGVTMIVLKTSRELAAMREAGRISARALRLAGEAVEPGCFHLGDRPHCPPLYRGSRAAIPTFLGYGGFPASACISVNNVVIHGIPHKEINPQGGRHCQH